MKKTSLFILMLFCVVSMTAATTYTVTSRNDLADANVHGTIKVQTQSSQAGQKAKVLCEPSTGYGLSRGLFYATVKNGKYSTPKQATCVSKYPDNRANTLAFEFDMPAENVVVWAYFAPLRKMKIHSVSGGYLKPLYGVLQTSTGTADTTMVYNVPSEPIELQVKPKTGYELVNVNVTNVDASLCEKSPELIKIFMPVDDKVVEVTPVFAKNNYKVSLTQDSDTAHVKMKLSNDAPKYREEVTVTLTSEKEYVPAKIDIIGCQWWRVGKPQRDDDGNWTVVYRFKVDLQDVQINVDGERVYNFTVRDTKNTGRIKTLIPEVIPDYPGVARKGQQIPVLFKMPENYSVTYTAYNKEGYLTPLIYHNVLQNSFADEGNQNWKETNDYLNWGLPIRVETDKDDNKYWITSVKNSMSQFVKVSNFPVKKSTVLNYAVIASINPNSARKAEVSLVAKGDGMTESKTVIADLSGKSDGWRTILKTGEVSDKTDTLSLVVNAQSDSYRKQSYDGPMFDDLCLLLPMDKKEIRNEDVLIYKMTDSDMTINYTPKEQVYTATVNKQEHATLTLHNLNTDEQGNAVKVLKNDVVVIKGQYDEGYAIYDMKFTQDGDSYTLAPDSVNTSTREVFYHMIIRANKKDFNVVVTPEVEVLKVKINQNYGGAITVNNENAKEGDQVVITVTPNADCKLKQIRTNSNEQVTITASSVDATTGAGTYSFTMPKSYVILIPEFIVPISTGAQIDSLDMASGDFYLVKDLTIEDWNEDKEIIINGNFDGKGHRITYTGETSLFYNINKNASVRHLYVHATVVGEKPYLGGISMFNEGLIEDCEVKGSVRNKKDDSSASGIVGQNGPNSGVISYCHVLCSSIDAPNTYGIANQETDATIQYNIFNGKFAKNDGNIYLICNDEEKSTIADNYYLSNGGSSSATICKGAAATETATLVAAINDYADKYPVLAASIRNTYVAYNINYELPSDVTLSNASPLTSSSGYVINATVLVSGNQHLESITISAPDGSDAYNCPFVDDTDNGYDFSFTMPEHDVKVTFTLKEGRYIYTAQQFAALNNKNGLFFLARDLYLHKWNRQLNLNGTLYGNGHTIHLEATDNFKGLFTMIRKNAVLDGVRVVGAIETSVNCGGLVFENFGTVRNCHFVGRITRVAGVQAANSVSRVAAIAYKVMGQASLVDHCSATGELKISGGAQVPEENALCAVKSTKVKNSHWISSTSTSQYPELLNLANAARNQYPVYAQGILDKINARLVVGSDTTQVENGQTLDELTIYDDKRFVCTSDVKVNRIIYKRKAMAEHEQWILPFGFDQMTGNGSFEYHRIVDKTDSQGRKVPAIGPGTTLTLSSTPSAVSYKANEPLMVKTDGSGVNTYVFTNASGPITIKSTYKDHINQYASMQDVGDIYVTYDSIPDEIAKGDFMYIWDSAKGDYYWADSTDVRLQPFRYYLQFSQKTKGLVRYSETSWDKSDKASARTYQPTRRRTSDLSDGWQPIFLDPRQPQSVTGRMLENYEVAYLTDIRCKVLDEDAETPLSAVTLVYQMVNSRIDLPEAYPLLVRAKRSDAPSLVDAKTGAELDSLIQAAIDEENNEDTEDIEEEDIISSAFEMPHYWCAGIGKRLDIWPMPASEKYADMAQFGAMLFSDNYFDQTFLYADDSDPRSTAPMSYCITVLNTDTYELLPLLGNRVSVEFIEAEETTGIESVNAEPAAKVKESEYIFNLSGQRVGAGYKGIIVKNGRKLIKR